MQAAASSSASVSPGKSLPGLWGALVAGALCACVLLGPLPLPAAPTLGRRALLGLVLAAAGVAGDLAESSVKRLAGKKDSGRLLPGHGGVLDRFDSLLVAGTAYYYLVLAE